MTRTRTFGTRAALGGLTAAVALLTAPLAASADEVSDLKANQELLQQRVDQLAQARIPGNPYGIGGPPGPVNVQMTGGSFPRSFLIPGTDTSIRVGGEIRLLSLFWVTGGNQGNYPGTNAGTTGQLNSIPLTGTLPNTSNAINRVRGADVFDMSPQQSKMSVETRTPTAWGEARSFLEFDFAGGSGDLGSRPQSTSSSLVPRLRYAYGTLGPLLFGQANSNFNDSDAGVESLEFGGLIGGGGPSRVAQIRWTQPLAGYGLLGALSVAAEAPETEIFSPGAGVYANDAKNDFTIPGAGGVGSVANPLKAQAPAIVAAWYIPQPWGHVDFSAVWRPTQTINTSYGQGIDKSYMGWALHFSGDIKPRWFGWDKDFITWNVVGGQAAGRYLYAGSGSSIGLVSNMTGDTLANGTTLIRPTQGYAANIGYRHQWTDHIRSNVGFGIWQLDVNGLNNTLCSEAGRLNPSSTNGCGVNTRLMMAKANLVWQPISFVDFGLEYNYGLRKVFSGAMGNEHVIVNRMRLRF